MKTIITKNEIICAVAYYGIYQCPYNTPDELEKALKALVKRLDSKGIFNSLTKSTIDNHVEFTSKQINSLLEDLIFNTPEIAIWNVSKSERKKGITDPNDPKRTVTFSATSRHGQMQPDDQGFIDLHALQMNVFRMLWDKEI